MRHPFAAHLAEKGMDSRITWSFQYQEYKNLRV
ncbi:hypothetical protein MKY41_10495 [Sporosarcina sp. FSL W7-1349]